MNARSLPALALLLAAAAITAAALASTSTSSGSTGAGVPATATPSFGIGRLDFRVEGLEFRWTALPGANSYRLKGQVEGFSAAAGEDRCGAISRDDRTTAAFDVTLPAGTTSYTFASPAAGKTMLVNDMDVRLDALSSSGQVIESSPIRIFGPESGCETHTGVPTPLPRIVAPNTGSAGIVQRRPPRAPLP